MHVSIVINNHNYGRFLSQAIDSALAQSHPGVEVIVCDDASTDDSWAVIGRYGDRIRALRNAENRGQAAAMNAGFAVSRGELVLFLDSDDFLLPDAVATCVGLFAPGVAKVQFPLRCVDADSRCLGRQVPFLMHAGDVRPIVRRFGVYAGPPSSGNCYRRSAIERYFPLVEADWRRAADTPPFLLAAFNGRVVNADHALGCYRIHSSANRARGSFGNIAAHPSDTLRVDLHRRTASLALLAQVDGIPIDGPFLPAPWNLRTRAMSWRLEPERHPFAEDSALGLLRLQARALRECPGYTWLERRAAQLWLLGVLATPGGWAAPVAMINTSSRVRRWLRKARHWRQGPAAAAQGLTTLRELPATEARAVPRAWLGAVAENAGPADLLREDPARHRTA
jgi:hypothetical protein